MSRSFCVLGLVTLAIVLGACGKSSEDKAKDKVCDARADIAKQVETLKGLTPATISADSVKQPLDAIKNDLKDISDAQSDLSDDRRSQVEAANKEFASSVEATARQAASSLSTSGAQAALATSVQQLEASYQKTLAPVNCD